MAEVLRGADGPDFLHARSVTTPRSRPETPCGLRTLNNLQKQVSADLRRTGASIALNKSMGNWISKKAPTKELGLPELDRGRGLDDETGSAMSVMMRPTTLTPSKIPHKKRRDFNGPARLHTDDHINLMEAFKNHSAAFDLDGDGTICLEELIFIFQRCNLFDSYFTPNKMRNYFSTMSNGCNQVHGLSAPLNLDDIGFSEFEDVLHWAADMKGVDYSSCVTKVVNLSRRLCDKEASVQRKIEVVFDACCKNNPGHMSAFEFGHLCRKIDLKFGMGDVFSLFSTVPGGIKGKGVDFQGFIDVLNLVGQKLRLNDGEVYATFATAVELLDTDEATIIKIKMRLKYAASIVGGADWKQFFKSCDADNSGYIDLDEFLDMCREKLHLADSTASLQVLFEKLDEDASGELSLEELIHFIDS